MTNSNSNSDSNSDSIPVSSTDTISPLKTFTYRPTEDISCYELACILKLLNLSISHVVYESLPKEVARHFISNKENNK